MSFPPPVPPAPDPGPRRERRDVTARLGVVAAVAAVVGALTATAVIAVTDDDPAAEPASTVPAPATTVPAPATTAPGTVVPPVSHTPATTMPAAASTTTTPDPGSVTGPVVAGLNLPFDPQAVFPPLPKPEPNLWVDARAVTAAGDGSASSPFASITDALAAAQPGDTIGVREGVYRELVRAARPGAPGRPIRVVAVGRAVITGTKMDEDRLIQLDQSYITIEGFEITNADKLVWLQGVTGVRILGNKIVGAGGECVRVKYQSRFNEIAANEIGDCGRVNFNLDEDRKNGEGIYVGTAPEQLDRNPTPEPDDSGRNWIHSNRLYPRNECVDIKEASVGNVVQDNDCTGQQDPNSAGLGARGNGNFFINNTVRDVVGAGIRTGGDEKSDGAGNVIVLNTFAGTGHAALKLMNVDQALICGNKLSGNARGPVASDDDTEIDPSAPCPA